MTDTTETPKGNRHQRRSAKYNKGPEHTSKILNLALMRGTLVKDVILQGVHSTYTPPPVVTDNTVMANLKRIRKGTKLQNDHTIAH
jgi:hypothetical protein